MTTLLSEAEALVDLCTCARCFSALEGGPDVLRCTSCGTEFPVVAGVLQLLPEYDEERQRYLANYDEIARADLERPFEHDRDQRHDVFTDFIGDTRGCRVLDVGSSSGGYLLRLHGRLRVATDIAQPFLEAVPSAAGLLRVRADAENLPFRPGAFDVVIVSDVLEHLLHPEHFVDRLRQIVTPRTRVIAHVPWKEDLTAYADSEYEFTHLRTFSDYTFARLWHQFRIVRERSTHPRLEEPIIFQLRRFLPRTLANLLSWAYFHGGLSAREYDLRAAWIAQLPRRERRLLFFYPPRFKMFELRLLETGDVGYAAPLPRWVRAAQRARPTWLGRSS